MDKEELVYKIRTGEIDINNQSLFFKILTRGLLVKLRQDIKIRNLPVPHYIINTGDEIMALEVKGQDHSIEPLEVSNEDYIYTTVPRCAVSPKGITLLKDQLTSPYSNGQLQYEGNDNIITLTAEFRRMPLKMNYELKYVMDNYTDVLELAQQVITKLAFIRNYKIVYMGQTINCTYKIEENLEDEKLVEFDEATTDDRRRSMTFNIEVETNLPVFNCNTAIPVDQYIKEIIVSGWPSGSKPDIDIEELKKHYAGIFRVFPQGGIEQCETMDDLYKRGEDPHNCFPPKQKDETNEIN